MNILIAPNSMKGSINAFDFADVVEKAFLSCSQEFNIRKVPVADGGDFTGEILKRKMKAEEIKVNVQGPLGKMVKSKYAISGKTAIIEMADASGIKLIKNQELNPFKASSIGTGQLISDAMEKGCDQIFIGIGGSATVDGGFGMMEALGFQFFNQNNEKLTGNGKNLVEVRKIQKPEIPENISFKIICDVDNPLLGPNGAASVFGPQKGATTEMVPVLEKGLKNWAQVINNETGKDLSKVEGGGAAGGIAVPLLAFFNAEIVPGANFILSQLNFDEHVKWADIVITGEGKIDVQTLNNKAPFAVAEVARKYKKPVVAIAGSVETEASLAFDGIYSFVNGPMPLEKAMDNVKELLFNFSYEFAKSIKILAANLYYKE